MKIYVGNITAPTSELVIRTAFENIGTVASVHMAIDRKTGKPQGFAIVDMPDDLQALQAIEKLHRFECYGSWWAVKQAR